MSATSGAVCPTCGVAVVPGYVRCPKCHKPLPRRLATQVEGGTAVLPSARKGSLYAVIGAVVVGIAILVYLGVRDGDKPAAAPAVTEEPEATGAVAEPAPLAEQPEAPAQPTGPSPAEVAARLERDLRKQRLWSTVSVVGDRVEVRSGSCADPAIGPLLDGAVPALKASGLTKLRCLEQSGRVVTDRDL